MRVVSLFSGAGGLDLGLIRAGHEIVWANDFDYDSTETYKENIGDHIVCGDVAEVDVSDIPDADVVVGGFPCQGYSQANLRRTVEDPRNNLFQQFSRILRGKQPKYFLAENVKGLLSLDGGQALEKVLREFESAGYRVRYQVLNAADFGVPQKRNRLIFLGTRSDVSTELEPEFPVPTHAHPDRVTGALRTWVSVQDALNVVPDPEAESVGVPNQTFSRYKVSIRDFTGHRATDPTMPAPTILARGNGGGGVCALPHPRGHRRMSIRESASIQTFPLDFEFVGKMGSAYRQVGNAVPVELGRALGVQLEAIEAKARNLEGAS